MKRPKRLTGEELKAYVAEMDKRWEELRANKIGNEITSDFRSNSNIRLTTIKGEAHAKAKLRKEQ